MTTTDCVKLQIEYLRSTARGNPDMEGVMGVMILRGAFRHIARRRKDPDSEARNILRRSWVAVIEDDLRKTELRCSRLFGAGVAK